DGSFQATRQAAIRLGIEDSLQLVKGVAKVDVPSYISRGDIFLNTTTIDNTPVSVLEAMACGLCVVSTNVGGIPYMLQHEHNALLVPTGDAKAMAAGVSRVLNEPMLAGTLSQNAQRYTEQLDWSAI